ncbi:MAG: hypothetical protein R6V58_17120 [Planctomycetota bacterium]
MRRIGLLSVLLIAAASIGRGADPEPFDLDRLPANQWTTLTRKEAAPIRGMLVYAPGRGQLQRVSTTRPRAAPLVYAPGRGQLLLWGKVLRKGMPERYDVRAFDAETARWVPDSKVDPPTKEERKKGGAWTGGRAAMLSNGTPTPSAVVHGACYDPKRKQIVVTLPGLMVAYDPATKKWTDLKAKTVIGGKEYPGGPPVFGVGTGYDPINDEIVLFPHWKAMNTDRRDVDGRISAHWGTFRCSPDDNTWRRVGETFGTRKVSSPPREAREVRKVVLTAMRDLSLALDHIYVARARRQAIDAPGILKSIKSVYDAATAVDPSCSAKPMADEILNPRIRFGKALSAGTLGESLQLGAQLLRSLESQLAWMAIEPPPRCATPLVYDAKNECLVMFGGHDGIVRTDLRRRGRNPTPPGRNDTWIYDCKPRKWRPLGCKRRPPRSGRNTYVFYDPHSGLIIHVSRPGTYARGKDRVARIWGLDVAEAEWKLLHTAPWEGRVANWYTVCYDPKHRLIVLIQSDRYQWKQCIDGHEVRLFKLDADKLTPKPAPEYKPEPPIKPHTIPPDDKKMTAKLKALPANKWVHVRPPRDADTRDWGTSACDRLRGDVYYYGGGHSTYQVNDVAIFQPGAGRWSFHVGSHNDWVPTTGWGGVWMGYLGGHHAHHMRNSYVAIDGRMYVSSGAVSRRWGAKSAHKPGPRYCWFYDVDRGGVWRQVRVKVTKSDPKIGVFGATHVAAPDGRVLGFGGALEPYDGRFFPGEAYFSSLDIYTNELTVKKIPEPLPEPVLEYRPFCFLPGRNQIFFFEIRIDRKTKKPARERTWVYDIETNKFINLKPAEQPGVQVTTVETIPDQNAVMAVTRESQYIYSFEHNTWKPLAMKRDEARMRFAGPYGQMVYSAKYGVFVNMGKAARGVAVMRPDVSEIDWGR